MATCDDLTYTLQGANLSDPDIGFKLLNGTEYAPAVSPRNVTVLVPGMHGSVPLFDAPLSPILVTLVVRVLGGDPDTLRTNYNRLMGVLYVGNNNSITVNRIRGTHLETAEARLVSTTAPSFSVPVPWVDVTIILEIQTGVWGGPSEDIDLLLNNPFQNYSIAAASTAPVANMLIRVIGPMTAFTIRDLNTNTGLTWSGGTAVTAAQCLIIEPQTMRAWVKPGTTLSPGNATQDRSQFLRHEGVRPFAPKSAVSYSTGSGWTQSALLGTVTTGTAGTSRITIRARPANF